MRDPLNKMIAKVLTWRAERAERAANPDAADPTKKSLRDYGLLGGAGGQAYVIPGEKAGDAPKTTRLFRKQNVVMLRAYAEFSVWVRAAIDIYRQEIAMAKPLVVPVDPTKRLDEKVQRSIQQLLADPNQAEEPYSDIKEKFIEDYLVIGHGAMEKRIKVNGEVINFYQLDAARIGFVNEWDGTDLSMPRYALFGKNSSTVTEWIPDAKAMVLVNRPRSYDKLGLSHVETLDQTIRALLEGDQLLINEIINPTANGMIDLGENVPPRMVAQIRSEIEHLRRALLVIANTKNSRWHSFADKFATTVRKLDRATWFVRQVAAVFQIPMAKLQIAVDESRANTEAQFKEMSKGPLKLLERVQDLENANITLKLGDYEKHNCIISYPALAIRDEAEIAKINNLSLGGQAYISINDARRAQGTEPLDTKKHPGADDIWLTTSSGPVPMSVLELKYFKNGKPVKMEDPVAQDAGANSDTGQTDKGDGEDTQPVVN